MDYQHCGIHKYFFLTLILKFHRKEGRTLAKRSEFCYFNSYYFLNCAMQFVVIQGCGHDRMVVGFTTTCAISAYHH